MKDLLMNMTTLEIICQIGMLIFGGLAVFFISKKNKWMKWGFIFGLMGQPAWFYVAITTKQWGMLALVVFYTFNWAKGIYNYWIKKDKEIENEEVS